LASLALIPPHSKIALALKRHLELLKSHYIHPTYPNTSFPPHRITFLTPLLIIPPIPLLPPASTCSRLSEVV